MKTIKIDYITKIEGHAKLYIKVDKGVVKDVRMEVVEGARFFEGMLVGKRFDEVPIITSRICGVCPQAHSLASIHAIEEAFGVKVNEDVKKLREALLMGQIIKSHILHLYFLALPDYFDKNSIIDLVKTRKDLVELGIGLKNIGNQITSVIGGREIHSISNIPGGFTKFPSKEEISKLKKTLIKGKKLAMDGIKLFAGFSVPNYQNPTQYLHLKSDKLNLFGDTICSETICDSVKNYAKLMDEFVETYSSAKHVTINDKSFFTGALARMNHDTISSEVQRVLDKENIVFPNHNPYLNNLAQSIEVYEFTKKAIKLLDVKEVDVIDVKPKKSSAVVALEAPRGILFHEYDFDKDGFVTRANIITPTTQNLKNLEEDIKNILPQLLSLPEKKIVHEIEKLIRAYDPCISCSTHFLKVTWDKS